MKALANSNGSGLAKASEINRARSSIGAVRIFYFWGLVFCHALVKETERQMLVKGGLFNITQAGLPT